MYHFHFIDQNIDLLFKALVDLAYAKRENLSISTLCINYCQNAKKY